MIPADAGVWTLPLLEHADEWFAYASTAVARSATELYGVPMTALREIKVADCRVCELEIQAPQWTAPTGTRWIASGDLAATAMAPATLSSLLREWFVERESDAIPIVRPSWERRGWYAEAVAWILSECSRLGYTPSRPVEQLKAAWSSSSILRINTSAGDLYFKAVYPKRPSEPAVIEALAKRWPRNVPTVVATNHDRCWMLMRDFGEHTLDREPIARWQAANRIFSGIQVACSADLDPWWRLQCPDLRIPVLVACMDQLLGDAAALRIDERGGLTTAAVTRLRDTLPRLHDLWGELAKISIPASIVQQDFRHGNLVIWEGACVFYDWSDTVVSHPFFSCCRFLDFVEGNPHLLGDLPLEKRVRRIADAYLQPWTRILGDADLRRAFELARQLNPIYLAIRWYLETPYCEPASAWGRAMREAPAGALRRWLARTDKRAASP
jgi:hypothetical protein